MRQHPPGQGNPGSPRISRSVSFRADRFTTDDRTQQDRAEQALHLETSTNVRHGWTCAEREFIKIIDRR
jgi:hypothetical protein